MFKTAGLDADKIPSQTLRHYSRTNLAASEARSTHRGSENAPDSEHKDLSLTQSLTLSILNATPGLFNPLLHPTADLFGSLRLSHKWILLSREIVKHTETLGVTVKCDVLLFDMKTSITKVQPW